MKNYDEERRKLYVTALSEIKELEDMDIKTSCGKDGPGTKAAHDRWMKYIQEEKELKNKYGID